MILVWHDINSDSFGAYFCWLSNYSKQNLAIELSSSPNIHSVPPAGLMVGTSSNVPLLARVYLELGNWQWALSPGLDDDSIQGGQFHESSDFFFQKEI